MTPEELQQIRERCERRNDSFDARDEFARHARTDVPALLDEVERLTRELQVERCGVRPIDELLQRVTTDRDELHVAWKREREEVERLTRERDEARAKIERMTKDWHALSRTFDVLEREYLRAERERDEAKGELEHYLRPASATESVRSAAKRRMVLDGADAQALENAITLTERERDEARAALADATTEWKARRCECGADDFCKIVQERDEARDEAKELRAVLTLAGERLKACSYELTEFSYQEMASVLFDLPCNTEEPTNG